MLVNFELITPDFLILALVVLKKVCMIYQAFNIDEFAVGKEEGTIGVLEVRPHETITVYDGQPICLMEFYLNSRNPAKPYGYANNNYGQQTGPKLAKFFA